MVQRTLKRAVHLEGVGLHSGRSSQLRIVPALADTGIIFIRTDLLSNPKIHANFRNVVSTQLATTLGQGAATVSTVEHLMAAFAGLGIDNAIVEINSPEVPIMDGSSLPFVKALQAAGTKNLNKARKTVVLNRKVEVKFQDKWAIAQPSSRFEIAAQVEWKHPLVGRQEFTFTDGKTEFSEIAASRTFCMAQEVEQMRSMGLARGGSLENALVFSNEAVMNPEGQRFENEVVRHKVLDAIGDLKLLGYHLMANVQLEKAGHELHNRLLMQIFSDARNFEVVGDDYEGVLHQARMLAATIAEPTKIAAY